MSWVDDLIEEYVKFLKSKVKKCEIGDGWYSITTPFLNSFNDYIEIYCKNEDGKITITDDGDTISNLELAGVTLKHSKNKKEILERILLNYGVKLFKGELKTMTDSKGFPQAKHNLLSAMLEVADMQMLSKPNITRVFKENVSGYFEEQDIIYTSEFISRGATGIDFNFDFQIAGKKAEILINAFNIVNKTNLATFLFDWDDIKSARQKVSKKEILGLAIINDENREVKGDYLDALLKKGSDYVLWSERHSPNNIAKLNPNKAA